MEDGCDGGDGGVGFEEGGVAIAGGGAFGDVLEDGLEVLPDVGEEGLQAGGFGVGLAGAAEEDLVGADCGGVFVVVDFEEEAGGGRGVWGEEVGCVCEGCVGEGLGEDCGEGEDDEPAGWR